MQSECERCEQGDRMRNLGSFFGPISLSVKFIDRKANCEIGSPVINSSEISSYNNLSSNIYTSQKIFVFFLIVASWEFGEMISPATPDATESSELSDDAISSSSGYLSGGHFSCHHQARHANVFNIVSYLNGRDAEFSEFFFISNQKTKSRDIFCQFEWYIEICKVRSQVPHRLSLARIWDALIYIFNM